MIRGAVAGLLVLLASTPACDEPSEQRVEAAEERVQEAAHRAERGWNVLVHELGKRLDQALAAADRAGDRAAETLEEVGGDVAGPVPESIE